jgi:hypothetical protein
MADYEARKLERQSSVDPEARQKYLITQLRAGRYSDDEIIRCVMDRENPEMAERCLMVLPQVLMMRIGRVVRHLSHK